MTKAMIKRARVVVAVVSILSLAGSLSFNGVSFAPQRVTAAVDATITGKVVSPTGAPITFACMYPPGQTPPPGAPTTCSIGVEAMAGPDVPPAFGGANPSDGSFSIPVTGGARYQIAFRGPPEAIAAYTFAAVFVDIASGETKNIGTITATEKAGRISGTVTDAATGAGVVGARVSAFPMFGGPEQGGAPPGPMMPSEAVTTAGGAFTLKVDPGRYNINLQQGPGSSYVYNGQPIEANCDTATCNVTGITLAAIKADATITGLIKDTAGNSLFFPGGVGARPVGATDFFDYNGPIMPDGPMGPTGQPQSGRYTVKVPSTTPQYTLTVHTPPNLSYSTVGTVTVTVVPNGTVMQDLTLAADTSSIFGKVVSQSGFALSTCSASGDKFGGDRFGRVFANSPSNGKFAHSEIEADCSFDMTLGAGEYQFGYHLNPTAGYINKPAPPDKITVAANQDVEKNITVIAGDATISGQVLGADGSPLGNVWVDAGNEGEARKDFRSGGQEGQQGPKEGEFVGPGGAKSPEEMMKYCSDPKNSTECKNFKLPPGATGPDGCTNMLECTQVCGKNPQVCAEFDEGDHDKPPGAQSVLGRGVKYVRAASRVRVLAEDKTSQDQGPNFNQNVIHMGTQAGPDGKFTMAVVSGHVYEVRSNCPPDKDCSKLIPPKAVTADLRTVKTANVVLQFREAFGTAKGKVTLPNGAAADRCFVHYWSEDGGDGGAPCGRDGTYTLGYSQGKLHIGADSFNGKTPFRSPEEIVTITTEKSLTKNFTLKEMSFEVPPPVSKTFDATQQTTISLEDGTQITVPANALATSGNVTVSATPTIDLPTTENASPVGVGYTLNATDANGKTISTFNSNVTITMPYDEDYVKNDLGLNESLLKTVFKNDATNAYEPNPTATQDTETDAFTVLTNHFSEYTIVSPGGTNLQSVVVSSSGSKGAKIVINGKTTIKLKDAKANWNVGTANFGSKLGQLIAVSNKKSGGKLTLYGTNGKVKKAYTPFGKGFKGGLNQVVEDVSAKTGSKPDGTDDVAVAPAADGPAQAIVYNLKDGKSATVTTGTGTGKTTLNTAELLTAGLANLTTLYNDSTKKAFKMKKGKLVEATGSSITSLLTVKKGKVEKLSVTPKVKKVSGKCSTSATAKLTVAGSGFGTSGLIVLWNAAAALNTTITKANTAFDITVNPSAVTVKGGVNTLTIVNSDGQAGVGVVTCS